jgi:hypothetical protein
MFFEKTKRPQILCRWHWDAPKIEKQAICWWGANCHGKE